MDFSRRTFLCKVLATIGLATFWYPGLVVEAGLMSRLFGKAGKKTLPLTPNNEFYVTSIDVTPAVDIEQWTLVVDGLVTQSLTLSYAELLARPQVEMVATLECIGNPLGGEQIGTAAWTGIPISELLHEAGIDESGVDLVLFGADGYSDSFPVSRARREDVLLALQMNGVPLPADHGFPARVIVPGLYGVKNVKWLTKLEVVDHDYQGYWQREGWPEEAGIKPHSRIDLPGDRETVTTPTYIVQGIANGGATGIEAVEVSTDLGLTWQRTKLAAPLSSHAWRLWSYEWAILKPGEHTIMVRARNGQGTIEGKRLGDWHAVSIEAKI